MSHITKYVLEEDSTVEVHKIFGDEYYIAFVTIHGRYPEAGKIAHDINREEYLCVEDGEITVVHNKEKKTLKKGENLLIADGDYYSIEGDGRVVVFVKDGKDGKSDIVEE
ncbi:MAG TPA: hypothetical protein VFQ63_03480 [Patescibacteria group bacterium]|nr:hypothetical protein [Patescibacteria group bacterium]